MTPTNRIEELEAAWLEYADLRGVPHQDEYVDGGETFRKVLPAWERLDRAVKAMKAAPAPEDRIERESTIAELDPLFPATGVDIEYTDGNVAPAAQPSAPADGDVALEEAYQEGYEAGMIEGRDDAISIDKDLFRMLSAWVFEKTGTSWSDFPDGRSPHDLIDMLDEHFRSFKSPSPSAGERNASMPKKLQINRDWCLKAAEREGDAEVGAGYHSLPEAIEALTKRSMPTEEMVARLSGLRIAFENCERTLTGLSAGYFSEDQTELSAMMAADAGQVLDVIKEARAILALFQAQGSGER